MSELVTALGEPVPGLRRPPRAARAGPDAGAPPKHTWTGTAATRWTAFRRVGCCRAHERVPAARAIRTAPRIRPRTRNDEGQDAMAKARDIMAGGAECIGAQETVPDAARKMKDLGVGALPICGSDNRLKGVLTDRDIAVDVLGAGKDPATCTAGELARGEAVTIGADDDAEEILRNMTAHKVRRLPVIDGHDLVGMVAQADVARSLPEPQVGDLLQALSTD